MTYLEFVRLVQAMRTAQRDYFKSRTYDVLERSKALEKDVDRAIKDYFDTQRSFFPFREPTS